MKVKCSSLLFWGIIQNMLVWSKRSPNSVEKRLIHFKQNKFFNIFSIFENKSPSWIIFYEMKYFEKFLIHDFLAEDENEKKYIVEHYFFLNF